MTPQQHAEIVALLTRIVEALERRPRPIITAPANRHRKRIEAAVDALLSRGEIGAGTSMKAAHAAVLRELGVSPNDAPYGLKSREGVRLAMRRKETR